MLDSFQYSIKPMCNVLEWDLNGLTEQATQKLKEENCFHKIVKPNKHLLQVFVFHLNNKILKWKKKR